MILRVWRLGSLEHRIFPTDMTIDEFKKELEKINDNEFFDLVWTADLMFEGIPILYDKLSALDKDLDVVVNDGFPVDELRKCVQDALYKFVKNYRESKLVRDLYNAN